MLIVQGAGESAAASIASAEQDGVCDQVCVLSSNRGFMLVVGGDKRDERCPAAAKLQVHRQQGSTLGGWRRDNGRQVVVVMRRAVLDRDRTGGKCCLR
mgnify:CR=1 FL=1